MKAEKAAARLWRQGRNCLGRSAAGGIARITLALAEAAILAGCSGFEIHNTPVAPPVLSFDSCPVGSVPPDFTTALTGGGGPVSWAVREEPDAPGGHRVLVQESSDDTSYRFPLCVYDKWAARDAAAEVEWKALAGKVDEAGGIVLRYTPENYYIARANVLEDNVDLFVTVRGKRMKVLEVPVKVAAGVWHKLRFEAKGNRLVITFDGNVVIDTTDTTIRRAGKVGLWTKADSVSAFTDFKINPAD
jgi:hypothetical protein